MKIYNSLHAQAGMQNGPEDVADHDTEHYKIVVGSSTDQIVYRAEDSVPMPQGTLVRWGRLWLSKYAAGSAKNAVKYLMRTWHVRSTAAWDLQ